MKPKIIPAVQLSREQERALSSAPYPRNGTGMVEAAHTLSEFDGEDQSRVLRSHLSTLPLMGRAEISFGGLPRTDADRKAPRAVVTEAVFPLRHPGRPGENATEAEIKAWNDRIRAASDEERLAMACLSPNLATLDARFKVPKEAGK
jgi:hypothetical protein